MPASTVLALLTGLLAGAAVIAAVAAVRPVSPDLGDTLYRLHHPGQTEQLLDGRRGDRLGRWLMVRSGVFGGFAVPYADLDLLGMTPARFFTAKAIFATVGLVLPVSIGLFFNAIGLGVPLVIPAGISLLLGLLGWVFPALAVRRDATVAREKFARSITAYIDLVVLERLGGAGVASAISDPAGIAKSPLFIRIRQSIDRHRLERKAPWIALRTLANDIDLPQLRQLADTMELSGTKSAPVAETLKARARDIRNAFLNQDVERAGAASSRQTATTALLLIWLLAFLGFPVLFRLLQS
ncbi:MAG TPA: hypothetical protein VIT65_08560 [Microlunatus sp.]